MNVKIYPVEVCPVVLGILQNAWSPLYAGGTWPRASWLRALRASRSGLKLAKLVEATAGSIDFWWDNTTPIVGPEPRSVVPPDLDHLRALIDTHEPRACIAFGEQARLALAQVWTRRTLVLPHPAVYAVGYKFMETAAAELARLLANPSPVARTTMKALAGGNSEIKWYHGEL